MTRNMKLGVLFLATMMLAACGGTTEKRAATGGVGGAAAGAVVGGPVGALVGGAVGAGAGTALDKDIDDTIKDAGD